MSLLLCYWEEADRCLNHGEVKIKTHCPLGKLLLKFSSHSTALMLVNQPLFCSISDYSLSWQMLLTHWHPMSCLTWALGYQIYRVFQKFVPLISCAIILIKTSFLHEISKICFSLYRVLVFRRLVTGPASPLCFFITLCSRCGIKWDKPCSM